VLTISRNSYVIPTSGGSASCTINTNYPWTATCSDSWVKLETSQGQAGQSVLSMKFDPSTETEARTATVIVTCKTLTENISITQEQKNTVILDCALVEVSAADTLISVNVKHNIDVKAVVREGADWVVDATGKSMVSSDYSFIVLENPFHEERIAYVDFSGQNGTVSETLTIVQTGGTPNTLSFIHDLSEIMAPTINCVQPFGTILWGDGKEEAYSVNATHKYSSEGQHEVVIEIYSNKEVNFNSLRGIKHISLKEF